MFVLGILLLDWSWRSKEIRASNWYQDLREFRAKLISKNHFGPHKPYWVYLCTVDYRGIDEDLLLFYSYVSSGSDCLNFQTTCPTILFSILIEYKIWKGMALHIASLLTERAAGNRRGRGGNLNLKLICSPFSSAGIVQGDVYCLGSRQ